MLTKQVVAKAKAQAKASGQTLPHYITRLVVEDQRRRESARRMTRFGVVWRKVMVALKCDAVAAFNAIEEAERAGRKTVAGVRLGLAA